MTYVQGAVTVAVVLLVLAVLPAVGVDLRKGWDRLPGQTVKRHLAGGVERMKRFWFVAIEPERIVFFQRLFAATFLFYVVGWGMTATEWLTDASFHITKEATNPVYPMPFPSVPEAWLVPFLIVLYVTPTLLILNVGGRVAKLVMVVLAVYIQLVDQISSFTLNKLYIVFFAVLFLAPAPQKIDVPPRGPTGPVWRPSGGLSSPSGIGVLVSLSALALAAFVARYGWIPKNFRDAGTFGFWCATAIGVVGYFLQRPPAPDDGDGDAKPERVWAMSGWPMRLVQVTLMIQYVSAGLCKIFWGDWFKVPDILYGHSVGLYRTEAAAFLIQTLPHFFWYFLSYGALAFETLALLLFVPKRMRPWGALIGVVFHMTIALMMKDLIYFSAQMCTFYVMFLPARWVVTWERAIARRLPWNRDDYDDTRVFFEPDDESQFYGSEWLPRR